MTRAIRSSTAARDRAYILREFARQVVGLKVDVIFAIGSTETEAAKQATTTIPVVFAVYADPVGTGHVASLAQPGG